MRGTTHLIIGTKAQFIKMAPIAYLLEQHGLPYRIIDLSQHGSLTRRIIQDFALHPDIIYFTRPGRSVTTYARAFDWLARSSIQLLSPRNRLWTKYLRTPAGVALIHGDTLSTLLGLYLAYRMQLQVGLIEAGLTSRQLFDPFPEEMIRRHVESKAEYLFTPDLEAAYNLQNKRIRGLIINTGYNTGQDALSLIIANLSQTSNEPLPYIICTLHRLETLSSRARLKRVISHLTKLARQLPPVEFYLHEPTLKALKKYGLYNLLQHSPNIELRPLVPYSEFAKKIFFARAILTDGGSIQEEASYLDKPCLILRKTTERSHGLGSTACLSSFDVDKDAAFLLEQISKEPKKPRLDSSLSASRAVLEGINVL